MDNQIKSIEKDIQEIEDSDNYDYKVTRYAVVKKTVKKCMDRVNSMKQSIDNPDQYLEKKKPDSESEKDPTSSESSNDSNISMVPLGHEDDKGFLDKDEAFEHYIDCINDIKKDFENKDLDLEEKFDKYMEAYSIVKWCNIYLDKKKLKLEYV